MGEEEEMKNQGIYKKAKTRKTNDAMRRAYVVLVITLCLGGTAINCHPKTQADKFDIGKLMISVKPGERIGFEDLPDSVTVAGNSVFSCTRTRKSEKSGTGYKAYEYDSYHLQVIASPRKIAAVKIHGNDGLAEPLEIYPGVWLGKTTENEIIARFGKTRRIPLMAELGYAAAQPAWFDCEYEESTGVLKRFLVQYVEDDLH